MRVVVQVSSLVRSGDVPVHVLKYDVTYDGRLGVTRWQLLPGQGELVPPSASTCKGYRPAISESRKG
jgi:hypothetical protein